MVVVVPCSANEWMLSVGASESSRPSRPSESRSVSLSLSVSDAGGRSVRALAGGVENDLVRRSVLVLERVRPSAIAGGRSNHERLALPDDDDGGGGGGALGCRGLTGAVVGGCGLLLAAAVVLAAAAAAAAASRLSVKLARSSDAAVAAAVEAAAAARSEVALALELGDGALASNEPDDGDADAAATRAGVEVMAPESDRSPDLRLARYCCCCCCCCLACCCCCTTDDSNICCRCSSSNASGSRSARRWLSPLDCDRTRCKRTGFFLVLVVVAALALEAEAAAAAAFSSWLMASEVERAAPNSTDRVVVSGRQSTRQSGTRMSRVRAI